jgi:hypothetical protein
MRATIYLPAMEEQRETFMVRTAGDPMSVAPSLRRAAANLLVGNIMHTNR